MQARVFCALVSLGLSIVVQGQTNPPSPGDGTILNPDSAMEFITDNGNLPQFNVDSEVVGTNPDQRTVTMNFQLQTTTATFTQVITGVRMCVGAPTLYCGDQLSDDCLASPGSNDYPEDNVPYLLAGSRCLLLSFAHSNVDAQNSISFCRASRMEEFCENRNGCSSYTEGTLTTDWNSALSSNRNKEVSVSVTNLAKRVAVSGRRKKMIVSFTLEDVPDDFWGSSNPAGSTNPDFSLGLNDGQNVNMNVGVTTITSTADCTPAFHSETFSDPFDATFQTQPAYLSPNGRSYLYKAAFLTVLSPTPKPTVPKPTKAPTSPAPTKTPTNKPTLKPTLSPTAFPTKKPTTPAPTNPTSPPTPFPTVKPTSTPAPTNFPTKKPTTPKPTKQPTTPQPTQAPVPIPCPQRDNWNKCQLINGYFKHLAKRPSDRTKMIKSYCQNNGCYWCGYDDLATGAYNCRPRTMGEQGDPNRLQAKKDQVCTPGTSVMPFIEAGCELFPDCPPPEEMTACKVINFRDGYNKNYCEDGFKNFEYNGKMYSIGPKRCAYNNGVCRAVGDYYAYRKTIVQIPGFFTRLHTPLCTFSENLPPIPKRG